MRKFMTGALALTALALGAYGINSAVSNQASLDSEPASLAALANKAVNSPIEEVQMRIAYAEEEAGLTKSINSENYDEMMGLK